MPRRDPVGPPSVYLCLRRVLGLFRSEERAAAEAELEIVVPRHQFEPAAADVDDVTEQRYLAHEAMAWIDYFLDQERLLLDVLLGLNLCERSGLAAGVARGSAAVGIALDLGRLPRIAGRYHRRAVDLAERLGDPVAIGLAYLAKGVHGYIRGDPEVSIADCSHAADAYKEAGDLRGWERLQQPSVGRCVSRGISPKA